MPTLAPGWNLVPRWRTRMLPASTYSPPNFFTPRRRPALSRPLREEPPAFLCAMAHLLLLLDRLLCRSLLGRRLGLGAARGLRLCGGLGGGFLGRRLPGRLLGGLCRFLLRFGGGGGLRLGRGLAPLGQDLADADHREVLAVAVLAPVIVPPLLLEDEDGRRMGLLDHRRRHHGARHHRRAHLEALAG